MIPRNSVAERAAALRADVVRKLAANPISNFPANESGQSEAFAFYCAPAVSFTPGRGWLVFDPVDCPWVAEGAEAIVFAVLDDLARARFDLRAVDPADQKDALSFARAAVSFRGIRSVAELAKRSPALYRVAGTFDADPVLLNCCGLAVNLETGEIRDALPSDFFTMTTGCRPVDGPTPIFDDFMRQVSCGRPDVVAWLLRWFGYALTGTMDTPFFTNLWGGGRNGKGALTRLIRFIFGSYAIEVSPSVVIDDGRSSGPRPDICDLMGPRLGIIDEVPPGKLSVEVVKRLTGGDSFRAARKFQDDIEFRPRIKLTLASNNRLELQRVDVATVRRFRLVPFGFTIPEGQENPGLEKALASEAPAILARLIDEAREYLRDPAPRNFPKSETIDGASKEYVADEDLIQRFVDARCIRVGSEKSSILYSAFVAWANDEGLVHPWGPRAFGEGLVSKGFERSHTAFGNFYQGLSIK